jgi:hypothetical protein
MATPGTAHTLILLGSQPRLVLPVLQAARSLGIAPCILLGAPATRHLRWSPACWQHVLADLEDDDAIERQVGALARDHPRATLVPCDCAAIRLLQRLGDRLSLPTTPMPTAHWLDVLDDKWRFHGLCEANGLPVPPTVHAASKHALRFDELALALGVPFIVKPTGCSGSLGLVLVRSRDDFDVRILRDAAYAHAPLVAQRYIDGWDVDVDLFAVGGRLRAVTSHRVSGCTMEFFHHPVLEDLAASLCRLTAYSGPMNLDARIERATGRVFLIESNPRFWASMSAPLGCGLNFLAEALEANGPAPMLARRPARTGWNCRHPLLRPREWWHLMSDGGAHGRLLRTTLFDPYVFVGFVGDLPAMAARATRSGGQWLARKVRSVRFRRPAAT